MSDLPPVEGQVIILVRLRGADGRLREVEAMPPAGSTSDMVPTWDHMANTLVWRTPAELGFSPTPMIIGVPVVTGSGLFITDGDGRRLVCNVPSTGAA